MKKLLLFAAIMAALAFAGEVRQSESSVEPAKVRHLQGGLLLAWDVQRDTVVDESGTRIIYRYKEALIKPGDTIPAEAPLQEFNLQDFYEVANKTVVDSLAQAEGESSNLEYIIAAIVKQIGSEQEEGSLDWLYALIAALIAAGGGGIYYDRKKG